MKNNLYWIWLHEKTLKNTSLFKKAKSVPLGLL